MSAINTFGFVCAAALSLGMGSQAIAKPAASSAANALRTVEARWNADIKTRDPVKFASYYAKDATVMNPFSLVLHSRQSVEADMKSAYADPNFDLSFAPDVVGVAPDGAIGWTQGHFTQSGTDPKTHAKVTGSGSYLTIYRKEPDDAWKAIEDIATPGPAANP